MSGVFLFDLMVIKPKGVLIYLSLIKYTKNVFFESFPAYI